MLIMGWDGTVVTPQIRSLIEEHHLGSILLTAKESQNVNKLVEREKQKRRREREDQKPGAMLHVDDHTLT